MKTELRIGNWVKTTEGEIQIHNGWEIDEGNECNPIPLTEEWLERFGAKSDVVSSMFGLGNWISINLSNDGDFWIENITGEVVVIKYVHQLQNLYFALTGEELQTDETK
jgi:hypothetical protein